MSLEKSLAWKVLKAQPEQIREELAALAHEQWSGWMRYLFEHAGNGGARGSQRYLNASDVRRWQRQMETPYAKLSESEKESDRKEADRVLAILNKLLLPNG